MAPKKASNSKERPGAGQALQAYGANSANLKLLGRLLGIQIGQRGCEVILGEGSPKQTNMARQVIMALGQLATTGHNPTPWDTECLLNLVQTQPQADLGDYVKPAFNSPLVRHRVMPKTLAQREYLEAMNQHDLVFGLGPAGTGKTYLAVATAVNALSQGLVSKIIITRPAVEAGERFGFLPGDLAEKINPYLRPIYDALDDLIPYDQYLKLAERKVIEVAPLAFMRGRTLAGSYIILDEAQNCTREQMKMFLTRLGPGSRTVVTGDPKQSDLPGSQAVGLNEAVNILEGISGISFCRFGGQDVIRHRLVKKIIEAYEGLAAPKA